MLLGSDPQGDPNPKGFGMRQRRLRGGEASLGRIFTLVSGTNNPDKKKMSECARVPSRVGVGEVGGNCVQLGVALSDGGQLLRPEAVMSEPLDPNGKPKPKNWPLASRPDPQTPSWRWHVGSWPPPTNRSSETPSPHCVTRRKASSPMRRRGVRATEGVGGRVHPGLVLMVRRWSCEGRRRAEGAVAPGPAARVNAGGEGWTCSSS